MLRTIEVPRIKTAVKVISAIEAEEFLYRLVRFDTSIKGPTEGADTSEISRFLLRYITSFGISAEIIGPSPEKSNVVWYVPATVPADECEPAIVFISHSDVAPPGRLEDWNYPPFSGTVEGGIFDGMFHGRGVVDNKARIAMDFLSAVRIMNSCPIRKRKIIGLVVCDEEIGGDDGTNYLLDTLPYLQKVECFIDEGTVGVNKVLPVATQERVRVLFRASVQAKGGHSALMGQDAIEALNSFIEQVKKATWHVEFHPAMRGFLRGAPPEGELLMGRILATSGVLNKWTLPFLIRFFEKKYQTSFVSTIQCTYFSGGHETGSLVADHAEALLDAFLMPNHSHEAWLRKIESIAQNMDVKIKLITKPYEASPTTPWSGPIVEALQRTIQKLRPGYRVLPLVGPTITEARHIRKRGIKAFGFVPIFPTDIPAFHGPNEKLSKKDFFSGIEFMEMIMRDLVTN